MSKKIRICEIEGHPSDGELLDESSGDIWTRFRDSLIADRKEKSEEKPKETTWADQHKHGDYHSPADPIHVPGIWKKSDGSIPKSPYDHQNMNIKKEGSS